MILRWILMTLRLMIILSSVQAMQEENDGKSKGITVGKVANGGHYGNVGDFKSGCESGTQMGTHGDTQTEGTYGGKGPIRGGLANGSDSGTQIEGTHSGNLNEGTHNSECSPQIEGTMVVSVQKVVTFVKMMNS